jgi:hypothetical protein
MENMNVNAYKPKFNWLLNDNDGMGIGFVENLDTFRTFADSEFRLALLVGWKNCLYNELDLADHDMKLFKNIDIDKTKLHDDIESNIRYYKLSFGWDLYNWGANLGNVHKFRYLHPLFRKKMLDHWIKDVQYAIKINLFDYHKENKHKIKKKNLTSSST